MAYTLRNGANLNSQKIVSLADPTAAQDAATKAYVDGRKVAFAVGNGSDTTFVLTHNLGTTDVHVTIYEVASGAVYLPDTHTRTTTQISLTFAFIPTSNQFRVVVS